MGRRSFLARRCHSSVESRASGSRCFQTLYENSLCCESHGCICSAPWWALLQVRHICVGRNMKKPVSTPSSRNLRNVQGLTSVCELSDHRPCTEGHGIFQVLKWV